MPHPFDRDISVKPGPSERYAAAISDNWSVNGVPNGGYTMAILAAAMADQSRMHAAPLVTANYLARCRPGPVDIQVAPMSRSTQFERFQATLVQDGKEAVRAFGTFSTDRNACSVERYEERPPALPRPEACTVFPAMPRYTIFDNLDVRLDPACDGWMTTGSMTDTSELRGWVRFREARPFDTAAVLLAADAFPPAVFASQGMVAWVPTIEMSVSVRNPPVSPWLCVRLRTRFVTCGLLEEDGQLWDEAGNLVAVSRQIAQYRPAG